jgi:hypothetical protein
VTTPICRRRTAPSFRIASFAQIDYVNFVLSERTLTTLIAAENETFSRHRRYGRMTQPDTWYVAFGPDKAVKTDDSATGMVRSTRTFKSEVDAKLFAMQILAKGWSATAGTLNPHQPKQIVGSAQIERWADPGLGG